MRGSLAGSKVLCRLVVLAAAIAAGTEAPSPFPKFPPPPPHLAPLLPTHPNPTQPNPTQFPKPKTPTQTHLLSTHFLTYITTYRHLFLCLSVCLCLPLSVRIPNSRFLPTPQFPLPTRTQPLSPLSPSLSLKFYLHTNP